MFTFDPKETAAVRQSLQCPDKETQRKALEQIIRVSSTGRDMSGMFADVARLFIRKSLKIRRLIYIFFSSHGPLHPEKIISVLQLILSDLYSSNYHTRIMALKCLASLSQIEFVADAFVEPLFDILYHDSNEQVRKTAILAAASVFHTPPPNVDKDRLKDFIFHVAQTETSPEIIGASCFVLCKFMDIRSLPDFIRENLRRKFLHALNGASQGVQVHILRAIAEFEFENSEDVSEIIVHIKPLFHSVNTALVIAASKTLVTLLHKYSDAIGDDNKNSHLSFVLGSLTFQFQHADGAEHALYYLQVIRMVFEMFPSSTEHIQPVNFYLQSRESNLIQLEKIKILRMAVSDASVETLLTELREYTKDFYSPEVSVASIRCITEISLAYPRFTILAGRYLKEIVSNGPSVEVWDSLVECSQHLLRLGMHEELEEPLATAILSQSQECKTDTALVSFLWIVGEYSHLHENAQLAIRLLLERLHKLDLQVQLALLRAAVKLKIGKDESNAKNPNNGKSIVQTLEKFSAIQDPFMEDRVHFMKSTLTLGREPARRILFSSNSNKKALPIGSLRRFSTAKSDPASIASNLDSFSTHVTGGAISVDNGKPDASKQLSEEDSAHVKPKTVDHLPTPEEKMAASFDDLFVSDDQPDKSKPAEDKPKYEIEDLFD